MVGAMRRAVSVYESHQLARVSSSALINVSANTTTSAACRSFYELK